MESMAIADCWHRTESSELDFCAMDDAISLRNHLIARAPVHWS